MLTHRPTEPGSSYLPALDGLRALAITSVLLYHDNWLVPGGYLGVDIFFVISGFLITSLLIREYGRNGNIDLKHFYLRRALRLFPALWTLLAIATAFALMFPRAPQAPHIWRGVGYSLIYLSNWANARDPFLLGPFGHTWSLAIEEQFYFLWPLVLWSLLKYTKRWRTVLIVTLALAAMSAIRRLDLSYHGTSPWRIYNGSDTRADSLLVGCGTAILMTNDRLKDLIVVKMVSKWLAVGGIALIGYLMATTSLEWSGYGRGMFSVVAMAASAILVALLLDRDWLLTRLLSTRIFIWAGQLSYSLYLWHYPIYQFMKSGRLGVSEHVLMPLRILLALLAAVGSFYLIERPFLRLKSRIGSPVSKTRGDVMKIRSA